MNCRDIETQEMIDKYLRDRLSERETEEFEQHYFGCARCFAELQWRHAAVLELNVNKNSLKALPKRAPRVLAKWRIPLAAAATILLAAIALFRFYHPQMPVPSAPVRNASPNAGAPAGASDQNAKLQQLAMIEEAPPYVPSSSRGGEGSRALERFKQGMEKYVKGKYADAIPSLEQAARLDPKHLPATFYLGICYLMTDQTDYAVSKLSRLTQSDSNPFGEESHWFLAKAYLRKQDLASAKRELNSVIAAGGLHRREAEQAAEVLNELNAGRH
ncbi:MAG TPA: tetratricopeptide repeat protein [Acidobacteriota bacterium]|jgi:tetratricopeptide (TPR) repeat protein